MTITPAMEKYLRMAHDEGFEDDQRRADFTWEIRRNQFEHAGLGFQTDVLVRALELATAGEDGAL